MPRSRISAWKPRFVITVTATWSTSRSSARIATIWSPSTASPLLVDREHAVAVAVERDPEVEAAVAHGLLEQREVGRAAADVDVRAVGLVADRVHLGAERSNACGASPE